MHAPFAANLTIENNLRRQGRGGVASFPDFVLRSGPENVLPVVKKQRKMFGSYDSLHKKKKKKVMVSAVGPVLLPLGHSLKEQGFESASSDCFPSDYRTKD